METSRNMTNHKFIFLYFFPDIMEIKFKVFCARVHNRFSCEKNGTKVTGMNNGFLRMKCEAHKQRENPEDFSEIRLWCYFVTPPFVSLKST